MTSISLAKKQKKITRFISSSYRKHTRKKYNLILPSQSPSILPPLKNILLCNIGIVPTKL